MRLIDFVEKIHTTENQFYTIIIKYAYIYSQREVEQRIIRRARLRIILFEEMILRQIVLHGNAHKSMSQITFRKIRELISNA